MGDIKLNKEIAVEAEENIEIKWNKKVVSYIRKILFTVLKFLISMLKVLGLFLAIAMGEKYGQSLRENIHASDTEYNIASIIYNVLITILKIFFIMFFIIPFIFYKLVCIISGSKK